MKIDLDKEDILCLVRSKSVPHELIDDFINKGYGHYVGGFCVELLGYGKEVLENMKLEYPVQPAYLQSKIMEYRVNNRT